EVGCKATFGPWGLLNTRVGVRSESRTATAAVVKRKRLWVGGSRGETGVSPVALPLYWSLLVHSRIQPSRRPGPCVGIHARQSVCDSGVGQPERPFRDPSSTPNR